MSEGIVLGLLPSGSAAESAVDNLTEQDFSERSISVVMQNEEDGQAIAGDAGPLKGVTASNLIQYLTHLGATDLEPYSQGLAAGGALIAVAARGSDSNAVRATLEGYAAQRLQEV